MTFPYPRTWTPPFLGPALVNHYDWPTVDSFTFGPVYQVIPLTSQYLVSHRTSGPGWSLTAVNADLSIGATIAISSPPPNGGVVFKLSDTLFMLSWNTTGPSNSHFKLISYNGTSFTAGATYSYGGLVADESSPYWFAQTQTLRAMSWGRGKYGSWLWDASLNLVTPGFTTMPSDSPGLTIYADAMGGGNVFTSGIFSDGTTGVGTKSWARVWNQTSGGVITYGNSVQSSASDVIQSITTVTPPFQGRRVSTNHYWIEELVAGSFDVRVKHYSVSGTTTSLDTTETFAFVGPAAAPLSAFSFTCPDGSRETFIVDYPADGAEGFCVGRHLVPFTNASASIDAPGGTWLPKIIESLFAYRGGSALNYNGLTGACPSLNGGKKVLVCGHGGLFEYDLVGDSYDPRMIAPVAGAYIASFIANTDPSSDHRYGREKPSPRKNLGFRDVLALPQSAAIAGVAASDELQLWRWTQEGSPIDAVPLDTDVFVLSIDPSVRVTQLVADPRKWEVKFCGQTIHVYRQQGGWAWGWR